MTGGNNCINYINKINHCFSKTYIKHAVSDIAHEK